MSQCNFCTYRSLEKSAEAEGRVLLKKFDPMLPYFPDGVAIHTSTKEQVDSHKTYLLGEAIAWFAELPKECQC